MPSLKEVKNRITSVNNTRKITSAMKMIASSKLHKSQQQIENMLPYEKLLHGIMAHFIRQMDDEGVSSLYASTRRDIKRVALVAISSNTSLCGAFNGNVARMLKEAINNYKKQGVEEIQIYPIGRKIQEVVRKNGWTACPTDDTLLDKPTFDKASELAERLMQQFANQEIDRVDFIYHHFASTSSQQLKQECFLPVQMEKTEDQHLQKADYILEPSLGELVQVLIPKTLHLRVYTTLLDSLASEHAARVIAMQVATDNADELLQELTLMYNKSRQQAITTELLDIVGGSMQ